MARTKGPLDPLCVPEEFREKAYDWTTNNGGTIVRICQACGDRKAIAVQSAVEALRGNFNGLCRRCTYRKLGHRPRTIGPGNPNFKTGRTVHNGYVLVHSPDHPNRNAMGSGYVAEHRLVMEERLGRYLLPGETVHHKNGIRHDNRDENLELWTRPQPSGVRAGDAHCPTCTCGA